ncbi:hypothetical protein A3Q56_07106 [Intoshia linei]|uniref:Uncharacterized protein n=1 Tax=Intoshia linei TaxID=1819745 RepID=A0A177AUW6_9BILA|nr:hypothetical protein A3Q56_07106 [Intoshia linei]
MDFTLLKDSYKDQFRHLVCFLENILCFIDRDDNVYLHLINKNFDWTTAFNDYMRRINCPIKKSTDSKLSWLIQKAQGFAVDDVLFGDVEMMNIKTDGI